MEFFERGLRNQVQDFSLLFLVPLTDMIGLYRARAKEIKERKSEKKEKLRKLKER